MRYYVSLAVQGVIQLFFDNNYRHIISYSYPSYLFHELYIKYIYLVNTDLYTLLATY